VISTVGRNTRSSSQIACIWVIAAKLDIRHVDESTHFCCHFPVVADAGDTAIGGVACFQCSVCDDSAATLKKIFTKQEEPNMKNDAGFSVWYEFRNQVHVIPFHGRSPDQGEKL